MAKGQQGKKASTGTRNPDRKCGKAWKKNPGLSEKRTRTPDRKIKDEQILELRLRRYEDNRERRAAEKAAAEALAILKAEEEHDKKVVDLKTEGYGKSIIKQKSRRPAKV